MVCAPAGMAKSLWTDARPARRPRTIWMLSCERLMTTEAQVEWSDPAERRSANRRKPKFISRSSVSGFAPFETLARPRNKRLSQVRLPTFDDPGGDGLHLWRP